MFPSFLDHPVCLSGTSTSEARTAGRIGTGDYSFDAPEQRKDDSAGYKPITCTCHVPRAIVQTLAKKVVAQGAGQTNGRIRLKFGGLTATITCSRHTHSDFRISPNAEPLVARGTCHVPACQPLKKICLNFIFLNMGSSDQ